jgi:hypothetical protein
MSSTNTSPSAISPFAAYANARSPCKFDGQLLKFTKGEYLVGPDNVVLPVGTKVVAAMDTVAIGWERWWEGRVTASHMGLLVEGFIPPERRELGDHDSSCWEVDSDGSARDPWQFTNSVVFLPPELGDVFTFTTTSTGGINAVADLCKAHDRGIRRQPRCYPVVSLESDSYQHKIKARGRIKIPRFRPVRYVDARPFDSALAVARGEPDGLLAQPTALPTAAPIAKLELVKSGLTKAEIDDDVPF